MAIEKTYSPLYDPSYSETIAARARLEILRGVKFHDENFVSGWVTSQVNAWTDGDYVKLEIATGQTSGNIAKSASFNTGTHKYAAIRCVTLGATSWDFIAKLAGVTKISKNFTTIGLKVIDLFAEYVGDIDQIILQVNGAAASTIIFDYVAICEKSVLAPLDTGDIIDEITVNQVLNGIPWCETKIPNIGGEYKDQIKEFDDIKLWLGGDPVIKVFCGKITNPEFESIKDIESYINIKATGYGLELQKRQFTKTYCSLTGGKAIIQESLAASCPNLTDMWVDPDNDIATTHAFDFDCEFVFDIIKKICDQAAKADGAVGFEFYVDPAKNVHVFPKNKYTSSLDLTGKIQYSKKGNDVQRIFNRIKIRGTFLTEPGSRDAWTESLQGWIAVLENVESITNCDSYTRQNQPTTNYGTIVQVYVGGSTAAGDRRYGWFKFPIGLYANKTITSAKLRLYNETALTVPISVRKNTDLSWTETGITWNNQPSTSETQIYSGNPPSPGWWEIDVKSYLEERLALGNTTLGFVLINATDTAQYPGFTSREGTEAQRARLSVTYEISASDAGASLESSKKAVGSYSLKFPSTITKARYPGTKDLNLSLTDFLKFKNQLAGDAEETVPLKLYKNAANYYSGSISVKVDFKKFDFEIKEGMTLTGSVDIINYIEYEFPKTTSTYIDEVYFESGKRAEATANDATSQEKYGICERPLEIDEMIRTNTEAQRKADGLRDYSKNPIEHLTLTVDGDPRFKLGDKQLVVIANDNINAYYRILRSTHKISGVNYSTILELSAEPEYVEAMFLLLRRAVDSLEKMQRYG